MTLTNLVLATFVSLNSANLILCHENEELDISTLRLVQTLFRNGDRNPLAVFKTDLNNSESTWQHGFGELTSLGVQQGYDLGRYIKQRYRGFLSNEIIAKEIHMQSLSLSTTIRTATAKLAGMYHPAENWKEDVLWQPISVHSLPKENDPILWMDKPCPTVDILYKNKVQIMHDYLKIEHENAKFLEFLRRKTGRSEKLLLMDLHSVWDPLHCEVVQNDTHTWPTWVTQEIFKKIECLYQKSIAFYYNVPKIQRFRGAPLFNEIATRFKDKANRNSSFVRNLKYFGYSVLDTTQIALLENLKAFDGSVPVDAQVLLFELHETNSTHFVKLFKKNGTEQLYELKIPICGHPCRLDKFYEASLVNIPEDWKQECGLNQREDTLVSLLKDNASEILFSAAVVVGFLVLMALLCFIFLRSYLRVERSSVA